MIITYYGHSCFGFQMGNTNLIVDPFISPNPLAEKIDLNSINADYILITHGHQDHVYDVEKIAHNTKAKIISNYEIVEYYKTKGIEGYGLNLGGKRTFDFGHLKYVNAIHSSVLPDGTYGGNPGGFVIWNDEIKFYIAGDTALTLDMQLIPMTCPALDFAILPIGDNFTMGVADAIVASDFIQCDRIIAAHYNTFPDISIDEKQAKASFKREDKQLVIMGIGESLSFE